MMWTHFENEWRIRKKVLNMKVKGKFPRGRPRTRWEQQVRKDVTQKEEHGRKLRRTSCGKPRYMEMLGCQMTHIQWHCLRRQKNKILH
jgi:hypothetical protein